MTSSILRMQMIVGVVLATANVFSAALAADPATTYAGEAVSIGDGRAHTEVRTSADGQLKSIGIEFTASMLEGLPKAVHGADPDFPYLLPMPTTGPKTVVDHVVINWESAGHPPEGVYDAPHFDFHFYLVSQAEQEAVRFGSAVESGDPAQQPPDELLPAGYVIPPGTAKPRMGVHAVNPASTEFKGKPFTATFIYGFYNRRQTFIEPMATLAFLRSKTSFSAPVTRPAAYSKAGLYPSTYSIRYDGGRQTYQVLLEDLR